MTPPGVTSSAPARAYLVIVIFIGFHYRPAGVHNSACNLITHTTHKLPRLPVSTTSSAL